MNKDNVFSKLEAALVKHIPAAVKAARLTEPMYCLRVYYDGTDTPEDGYSTRLRLLREAHRTRTLATRGRNIPFYLWSADETDIPEEHGPNLHLDDNATIVKLCGQVYQLLCDADDEEEMLTHLRECIQRVAQALNAIDWKPYCPVTDDFVVIPADGSHTFCDDHGDMLASVPAEKVARLRSRGQLGSDEDWAQVAE